jgi:hypothetical protein
MPGAQVIELLLSWIVTTALTFLVVIIDERRMRDDKLERAWPASSRDAAIVAFGVLALPVHFVKTRGHFRDLRGIFGLVLGLVIGIVAFVAVAFTSGLILAGLSWVLGLPDAPDG